MTCDAHDGGDSPRMTTIGPKSGLKVKICLKLNNLPPQVRYHQWGPGHNIRWDRSGLAAWPLVRKRKSGHTRTEKDRPTQKNTSKPKKRSPDCFFVCFCFRFCCCFCCCFCFCFTPLLFHDLKATKEKSKTKKKPESGSGHPWPGTDSGPGSGPLSPGF
jgi:hypothetical protein